VDLRAQFRALRGEIMPAIEAALEQMQLMLGPNTRAFEAEFAAYCGVRHAFAVSNGTDALHLALRACDIGPGDEVITVPNTFVATVEAIVLAGAQPVLVDVDPDTGNMDPARIEEAITPRTRALMPVHLYGQPADMDGIRVIAQRHNLRVIEDACQAHGAEFRGQRAGSLGDIACFSFYYSKNLGAYGEGGAVVTDDPELAERVRLLRDHGSPRKYEHTTFGFNARPDELQSVVLRVKLNHLDAWNERRRAIAARYTDGLVGLPLQTPRVPEHTSPVFHIYAVLTPRRDDLLSWLHERGIGAAIHYPIAVHKQPAYTDLARGNLAVAERWTRETLSLPIYAELSDDDTEYVIEAVRTFFVGTQ
jgi:dTDP-4-amino-4,6-dideoxygalactose transaminase